MEIGAVISRAWQIIWKHKILWIFGILAGCTNAGGGTNGFRASYQGQNIQIDHFFSSLPQWEVGLIVLAIIIVALVLGVIAIFLGTVGRIGLIRGVRQADDGAERLNFGELFSGSLPYFWRVFLLNLLVGLAAFVIVIFMAIAFGVGVALTLGVGIICLLPLICLLVPVGMAVGVIVEQANIAIIVEELAIIAGLKRGWEVVKNNAGTYILMWLILVVGLGLLGILLGLPLVLVVAPAIVGEGLGTAQAARNGLILAGVCLVGYLPILIFLNGVIQSFAQSAWTLTFMRLTAPKAPPAEIQAPPPSENPAPQSA